MLKPHEDGHGPPVRAGRRSRHPSRRTRRLELYLSDDEHTRLKTAAQRAGLAPGAYAARAALAAADGKAAPVDAPFREALGELIRAAGLVRRIGVNLNQAVAKLNATGQHSGDLLPYAAESMRRADRLDAAAERLRQRLR
jgi:Mobilization protein NikA